MLVNRIKEFLDSRKISPYSFCRGTGIDDKTGYGLYNNPEKIPSGMTLSKICRTYGIQPGEVLAWIEKE